MTSSLQFAVLGSPIGHSLSPRLHRAAFALQGLPWHYGRHEVDEAGYASFLASLDAAWRGLSLTMPLKRVALDTLAWVDPAAAQLQAVNTVRLDEHGRRGWNTDVPGAAAALRDAGVDRVRHVVFFGGGATAGSLLATVHGIGATRATVVLRDPAKATAMQELSSAFGIDTAVVALAEVAETVALREADIDLVVNTIPAANGFPTDAPDSLCRAALFEASYSPWPSPAAERWQQAGGVVIPGIDMLIHQAVLQQRIFVLGSPDQPLPREAEVLAVMRAAVGRDLDAAWLGVPAGAGDKHS